MTQRSRTEFAAPLEPGDDPVVGQLFGYRVGDVGRAIERNVGGSQCHFQLRVAPFPAEVGPGKLRDRVTQPLRDYKAPPSAVPASPAAG